MAVSDPLWTPSDLAAYLGRSQKTLANDRSGRRGPTFLKLAGGAVRYRRSDVEAWLRTQEQQAEAAPPAPLARHRRAG